MAIRDLAGTRVRALRLAAGLRQAEFAERVGISASYLNLIEHNRRRIAPGLLRRFAEALGLDPARLTDAPEALADGDTVEALAALATGPGAETEAPGEFLQRFPGWAAVLAGLYRQNQSLRRSVEELSDRMNLDPFLPSALHEVLSAAASMQTTAGILADVEDMERDWQQRFLSNLAADGTRLGEGARTLASYLEASGEVAAAGLASPLEEAEAWAAGRGWDLQDEAGAGDLPGPARALIAEWVARDREDRRACPEAALTSAPPEMRADPFLLAQALSLEPPVVMRRMALGPGRAAGLLVCDGSGTLLLRKPVTGFALPRFGGACPLWPLFTALGHPGLAIAGLLAPDSARGAAGAGPEHFAAHAFASLKPAGAGMGQGELRLGVMLLQPAPGPGGGRAALRVGSSCRVCRREGCPARREASILTY